MPFWPDRFHLETVRSGTAAAPFVGPLDTLVAQGATIIRAHSFRRLLTSYTGSAANLLRGNGSGSPEADIAFLPDGSYDLAAAEALRTSGGGTQAFCRCWYDQAGQVLSAEQPTTANQPPFTTSVVAKGALGGVASPNCWLTLPGGVGSQPFFIYAIVTTGTPSGSRHVVGAPISTANYLRATTTGFTSNFGASLSVTTATAGTKSLAAYANGASSVLYRNGTVIASGNNGSGSNLARLGASGTNTSWFTEAGFTLSEFIVFSGDPTALAGWSAFEAAARAYYS